MTKIRTIRLELLRHGPPHNQLLSPLTQYLAICGNHSTVTVYVPYEHAQYLARHNALTYGDGELKSLKGDKAYRELQLQLTAQELSELLARIPGLIADLSCPIGTDEIIHLELVLTASELALLPFELTNCPSGFPGAGQSLSLQSQAPICVTRRANRIDSDRVKWPQRFKILFACGLPDDAASRRLMEQHLLALRRAIQPWAGPASDKKQQSAGSASQKNVLANVKKYLTVLPAASVRTMEREMKTGQYTHVHILAHGVQHRVGVDDRFALQMRDSVAPDQFDYVTGERLAILMRSVDQRKAELTRPAVVTIASCHGGAQGTVVGAGSSIAHALHEAEIPLVVASQFPLSFGGSVLMTDAFYADLLWGRDPRLVLYDLRRRLRSTFPETHDWASLVVYAAFPADVQKQLIEVRYWQVRNSIETAFLASDWHFDSNQGRKPDTYKAGTIKNLLKDARKQLNQLRIELETDPNANRYRLSLVHGQYASTCKREAELLYLRKPINRQKWILGLQKSQTEYDAAFQVDRTQTWALVQSLVLQSVLEDHRESPAQLWVPIKNHPFWRSVVSAVELVKRDQKNRAASELEQLWTYGNLIELKLLELRKFGPQTPSSIQRILQKTRSRLVKYVSQILALSEQDRFQRISTQRQLDRYINWFFKEMSTIQTTSPMAGSDSSAIDATQSGLEEIAPGLWVPQLVVKLCRELREMLLPTPN